jgi:hypothetical protein
MVSRDQDREILIGFAEDILEQAESTVKALV